jgi:hypothetical protein
MSKMVLGTWADGGDVKLDLARLLLTRMLIQANSGNGKSWALRRLFERAAGFVQQIIVDPEGEFASLREKHDFVIVAASGGDAAAHPRTAALLALRLLETEASAVLDISELKAADRHTFVKLLFESLIDAPKNLRHPVLVALDEAQMFAPEKGQGESEATDSVIDMATRGRKRGLCLIAATQRISMFHKGVAAELKNRMIGGTSLDVDVKRAAFDLGMPAKDALTALRALEPGHFFAFGPALAQLEPREFVTGDVETSHPKVGHRQAAPPKPTVAILALLPKLADLPKEAEERARSIDDLKRELVQARRELSIAKKQPAPAPVVKGDAAAERRAAAQIAKLTALIEELMKFAVTVNVKEFAGKSEIDPAALQAAVEAAVSQARKLIERSMETRNRDLDDMRREAGRLVTRAKKLLEMQDVNIDVQVKHNEPFTVSPVPLKATRSATRAAPAAGSNGSSVLPVGEAAILSACIQFPNGLRRDQLTVLAGYKRSTRDAYIQRLREKGYVDDAGGLIVATEEGTAALPDAQPLPTGVELQEFWLAKLPEGEGKILQALIEAYPSAMQRDAISDASGFKRSTRDAYLQRMAAKQLVTEPSRGEVRASEDLFS